MAEIAAFFAATDTLALWMGRVVLWGSLLIILAGVVVQQVIARRERKRPLRASAVRALSRDVDSGRYRDASGAPRFRSLDTIQAEELLRSVGLTREVD